MRIWLIEKNLKKRFFVFLFILIMVTGFASNQSKSESEEYVEMSKGKLNAVDLVKYIIRMNYRSFTPGLMNKQWVKDVLAEKRVYRNFVKRFNTYLGSPKKYASHINERMSIYMAIKRII